MKHIWKINASAFERIKTGKKIRVYRVNDEKRKLVGVGDTIEFQKLPDLKETIEMDVKNIEIYPSLEAAITCHYQEDFKERHNTIQSAEDSFYQKGYLTKEEAIKNGIAVFQIKKHRLSHFLSTACYLKKDNKVLMIKFTKKWGRVYAPPGGKFESSESPLDCIIREYKEETGLTLINPKLQGISYWQDSVEGMIFVFTADKYEGTLKNVSAEGSLEWIRIEDLATINQFDQNQKFTPYLFQEEVFEGKFLLDSECKVSKYQIRKI